jgi:hypothetical protein
VFGGLGPAHPVYGWLPFALLPWADWVPLTARVRFGEENICWDPADTVLFCMDDGGGGWVLRGRDAPRVHRWDGCTHQLSEPLSEVAAIRRIVSHWDLPGEGR